MFKYKNLGFKIFKCGQISPMSALCGIATGETRRFFIVQYTRGVVPGYIEPTFQAERKKLNCLEPMLKNPTAKTPERWHLRKSASTSPSPPRRKSNQ